MVRQDSQLWTNVYLCSIKSITLCTHTKRETQTQSEIEITRGRKRERERQRQRERGAKGMHFILDKLHKTNAPDQLVKICEDVCYIHLLPTPK